MTYAALNYRDDPPRTVSTVVGLTHLQRADDFRTIGRWRTSMMKQIRCGCAVVSVFLVALAACNRRDGTATTNDGSPVESKEKSPTAPGWREFQIPDIGASVLMPVGGSGKQGKPVKNTYSSEKDGVAYIAFGPSSEYNVLVFTREIPSGQTVDQALDAHVKRYVEDHIPKGRVVEGVNMAGLPSRGYVVMGFDKPTSEDRVVVVGTYWVVLRVNSPPADLTQNKKFFDSFKLTAGH
jgi:hypothetical protein